MMEELVMDACAEMEKSWMKPEVGKSKQLAKLTGSESALVVLLLRVECAKLVRAVRYVTNGTSA